MANHKSALKRIRSNEARNELNRYQHKTARTWIKKVRTSTVKAEAEQLLRETFAKLDKLAKNNIIHKNKVGNLKSSLTKHVNSL
ncbi:MAG: 30S ribosomal protein S20 [Bacteroidetes bacterium]|nr:30S ribosomal protein S20 [Bacteroidota bacterium]